MSHCRRCEAEVKSHQIYCPNCGTKLPLLSREELKEFKKFKKKFKPVFLTALVVSLVLFALFAIRIPVTETVPYKVEEPLIESKPVETFLGCEEADFNYAVNCAMPKVFADILQLVCNIENLENEQGIFEYTTTISYKLSLEEKQKISRLLLNPYENKTVSIFFQDVKSPDQVDHFCKVEPPKKKVCKTKTEHVLVIEQREVTRTKQETSYKSLFELLLEKLD